MAGHSAIVDKSGRMWIFGGSTGSGLLYDIYHINLADAKCEPGNSGKWTKVSTKNPPAARSSHSAVYHGGRMWVFGGWLGGDAPYSNEHTLSADVHYLDLEDAKKGILVLDLCMKLGVVKNMQRPWATQTAK